MTIRTYALAKEMYYSLLIVLIIVVIWFLVFYKRAGSDAEDPARESRKRGQEEKQKVESPKKTIRVIAFDFDNTLIDIHAGSLLGKNSEIALHVSPAFLELAPALLDSGYRIAIATHSDNIYYNGINLAGAGMIRCALSEALEVRYQKTKAQIILDQIFIADADPPAHPGMPPFKKWHLKQIAKHFKCALSEILLIDDNANNIADAKTLGAHAHKVDPQVGFVMDDWKAIACDM